MLRDGLLTVMFIKRGEKNLGNRKPRKVSNFTPPHSFSSPVHLLYARPARTRNSKDDSTQAAVQQRDAASRRNYYSIPALPRSIAGD